MAKHFIISGIQGSGKGTQARMLEEKLGWVHIGTGALCRWHLAHRTTFGGKLKAINKGNLASDDLMIDLVQRRLDIHDFKYSFLLDGFPRNRAQAEYLFAKYEIAGVIHLELSQDIAMQRAQGRKDGKAVRADDNEEALVKRFEIFHKHTEPLIQLYNERNIFLPVDGSAPINTVHERILHALRSHGLISGDY